MIIRKFNLALSIVFCLLILSIITVINFTADSTSNTTSDDEEIQNDSIPIDEQEQKLQGYYFSGYIDMRDAFEDPEEEAEYIYYMRNYLDDYLNRSSFSNKEEKEDNYAEYFQQLEDGISPISFSGSNGLRDGNYIEVTFLGGIMESYPMQIGEVTNIEVITPSMDRD